MAPGVVGVPDIEDGVQDLRGHAVLDDPIVGREVTIVDDNGPGAIAVRPLPSPQQPSPQAMARHFLTHLLCQLVPVLRGMSQAEPSPSPT